MMSSLSGATLPGKMLSRRSYGKTIRELVEGFCPRDQDFQEVFGKIKTAEEVQAMIAAAKANCDLFIPFHQRFYVWDKTKQIELIDSVFKNYPMPNFIIAKGAGRGIYDTEDGQQRAITLWRYFNNHFPYEYVDQTGNHIYVYYDKEIEEGRDNTYSLEKDFPAWKTLFDEYSVDIMEVSQVLDESVIPTMFERLNQGKPLKDEDKFWNMKNTAMVVAALRVGADASLCDLLKKHFGIDVREYESKSRSSLPKLVGLVNALNQEFTTDDHGSGWGNLLTTSYKVIGTKCNLNEPVDNIDEIVKAIRVFMNIYEQAPGGSKILNNNTCKVNAAFTRHFGVMVYDWKRNSNLNEEAFINYWKQVMALVRQDKNHIDTMGHFNSNLYRERFNEDGTRAGPPGDNKGKNTRLGEYLQARWMNLKEAMETKGVHYYS